MDADTNVIIAWVKQYHPGVTDDEALAIHQAYLELRDQGLCREQALIMAKALAILQVDL